jgi:hypothetical protein
MPNNMQLTMNENRMHQPNLNEKGIKFDDIKLEVLDHIKKLKQNG